MYNNNISPELKSIKNRKNCSLIVLDIKQQNIFKIYIYSFGRLIVNSKKNKNKSMV